MCRDANVAVDAILYWTLKMVEYAKIFLTTMCKK